MDGEDIKGMRGFEVEWRADQAYTSHKTVYIARNMEHLNFLILRANPKALTFHRFQEDENGVIDYDADTVEMVYQTLQETEEAGIIRVTDLGVEKYLDQICLVLDSIISADRGKIHLDSTRGTSYMRRECREFRDSNRVRREFEAIGDSRRLILVKQ